jgi:hypothetical protein
VDLSVELALAGAPSNPNTAFDLDISNFLNTTVFLDNVTTYFILSDGNVTTGRVVVQITFGLEGDPGAFSNPIVLEFLVRKYDTVGEPFSVENAYLYITGPYP